MKTVGVVALMGAFLFGCGSGGGGGGEDSTEPLQEPCMSAPNDPPAPAWDGHTICHIPPGNPANAHTISVGAPAVSAHLAHGDTIGPCGSGGGGGGGGGTCANVSEACTDNSCCEGLLCVKADFTYCLGTAGCTCMVALN